MKTAAQRIAHYTNRLVSSLIDPVLTSMNMQQVENFSAYVTDFYPKQLALRVILHDLDLATRYFGAFEAFNGEMYHLAKVCQGTALVTNATILVAKWSGDAFLGATHATTLKKIAYDIYKVEIL